MPLLQDGMGVATSKNYELRPTPRWSGASGANFAKYKSGPALPKCSAPLAASLAHADGWISKVGTGGRAGCFTRKAA